MRRIDGRSFPPGARLDSLGSCCPPQISMASHMVMEPWFSPCKELDVLPIKAAGLYPSKKNRNTPSLHTIPLLQGFISQVELDDVPMLLNHSNLFDKSRTRGLYVLVPLPFTQWLHCGNHGRIITYLASFVTGCTRGPFPPLLDDVS